MYHNIAGITRALIPLAVIPNNLLLVAYCFGHDSCGIRWATDITKLKGPVKWTYFYRFPRVSAASRTSVRSAWTSSGRTTPKTPPFGHSSGSPREDVHYGRGPGLVGARQPVLDAAYTQHPERFVRKQPTAPQLPLWINPSARIAGKEEETERDKTP